MSYLHGMTISRIAQDTVESLLLEQPAVVILGPRQVGKTTLAWEVSRNIDAIYFDLEDPDQANVFGEPRAILTQYKDQLVILDEVQRLPGLFESLRGIIDGYRREGLGKGHFLLLGSASIDLLRQTSESLAGRVAYRELFPLNILEVDPEQTTSLWLRGGFPESLLASSNQVSMRWRRDFVRTYLERDIPQFDARTPSETLRRFWTMLAHNQGTALNTSQLAGSLGVDARTVNRYLDLLVDLLLVRRLQPWFGNVKKRLVKSHKLYLRDSGIVHSLLGIVDLEDLLAHPVVGLSWEGFVIENILSATPDWVQPYYYRTSGGAEIDLILEFSTGTRWAIEIKRSTSNVTPSKGFYGAMEDIQAQRGFIVYPGVHTYRHRNLEVTSIDRLIREIQQMA